MILECRKCGHRILVQHEPVLGEIQVRFYSLDNLNLRKPIHECPDCRDLLRKSYLVPCVPELSYTAV